MHMKHTENLKPFDDGHPYMEESKENAQITFCTLPLSPKSQIPPDVFRAHPREIPGVVGKIDSRH